MYNIQVEFYEKIIKLLILFRPSNQKVMRTNGSSSLLPIFFTGSKRRIFAPTLSKSFYASLYL